MSKDVEKPIKKESKILGFILSLFLLIAICTSIFAIYEIYLLSSIENLIRYIIMGILVFIDLLFIFKRISYKKVSKKKKKRKKGLYLTFIIFYSIICAIVGLLISFVYGRLDSLNKEDVIYTSNLIVMNSNSASNIKDIKDMKIGVLNDTKNPEGFIIPWEIIKENELELKNDLVDYDNYTSMLVDLYSDEIDAMFVSGNYQSMFSGISGYENVANDTKIIINKEKKMKKAETSTVETASATKSITEPFTLLLMGIDSTDEVLTKNAVANGDTLILITFNPKTLNATMISIPRDSYVPIACWSGKPENKITHAAAYGNDCMINTIEDYFDVNIDYYAKINFKGLVNLVNAVGGVDVDVPQELCTDDSNRAEEICIQPGYQTLNGEQALVFARNRKALANGDFGRGQHQQEIIMALINKMKNIDDVSKFMDILNTISNSMDTNLTTKQILSFYDIAKDIIKKSLSSDESDLIYIQQLFLQGTGQMIYDERARMVLWDYVPNKNSRKDIIQAMKVNLDLEKHEVIKKFSFSINEPYEKEIIGEGPYKTGFAYTLLPNFEGDSEAQARATASRLGISVRFVGSGGYVVSQSYPEAKRVDLIHDSLVLTLSKSASIDSDDDDKKTDSKKDKDSSSTKPTTKPGNGKNEDVNDTPSSPSSDDKDVTKPDDSKPTTLPSDDKKDDNSGSDEADDKKD